MKNKYLKGISANILLLGIVSFLNDFSSEMIMPILPMFITALGGAGLVVGLVGGLRESISSILKVFCGYCSDRTGKRKIFVSSGYLTSAVFKFLLSFSKVWQHILVFAGLERVGKGLRTAPRDAIIADSMSEQRGRGFGIHRTLDTLGAILGSAVVFILFWFLKFDFKTIIFLAALLPVFSLIPLHFVKEKKRQPQDITLRLGIKNLPKPLKSFILVSGVFALANFSYMFFILRAQEFFTGRLSVGVPILLYILFNVFYALFAIPFGALSDRIGRKRVLVFGYLLFSLTCLGFAFFNSLLAFIILFALYGMVYAIIDGNQRAFVSDLSSGELRATALGTFHTTIGLVALPSSLIAGLLWQNISPGAAFIYGSVVSTVSVVLFFIFGAYFKD
jgi:MFS family permease